MIKKIKVGAYVFTVEPMTKDYFHQSKRYAEFDNYNSVIKVYMDVSNAHILDSLLHEINHALYFAYGIRDEDNEERTVTKIASGWAMIYKDNPKLLDTIKELIT